jgi:amidophosphoribosyltransferase
MSRPREACGIYGVYDFSGGSVFPYIYWGLLSQNHRGQQSYGFTSFDGDFHTYKMLGLVPRMKLRKLKKRMALLPGNIGIGNVRYSTSGRIDHESLMRDTQPVLCEHQDTKVALSYNGNVVNAKDLRCLVTDKFGKTEMTADTELIGERLCMELMKGGDLAEAVKTCMEEIEGAYSVVGITDKGEFFAFRDRCGIKPLCLGYSLDSEVCAISSETVGLDINGLNHRVATVEPGELVIVTKGGARREQLVAPGRRALCSFEFAYFARPDSILNDSSRYVYEVRTAFGRNLGQIAQRQGVAKRVDMVIPVPETAEDAAYGFHVESGVPLERAMRRHRYVTDRAFIALTRERSYILEKKMNVLGAKVKEKKVALVDDSIVRGDTTKSVVKKMRDEGAHEVHVYITFPKIISPCCYGIDMATFNELVGSKRSPEEIAKLIGADSVTYQPIEDMVSAIGLPRDDLCMGCITGKYPTPLAQSLVDAARLSFERGEGGEGRIYEAVARPAND